MPTESYLGDDLYIRLRRYRDADAELHWAIDGPFTTYDTSDEWFADWDIAAFLDDDPAVQDEADGLGEGLLGPMADELGVDSEKLSAPGTPGTPPLTLTEDYLGDEVILIIKRYRDVGGDDALHWTSFGDATTYDDETDTAVRPRRVDDLWILLDGGEQTSAATVGDQIAQMLAAVRGVDHEKPAP